MEFRNSHVWLISVVAVLCLALAAYGEVLDCGLFPWDDEAYRTAALALVHSGSSVGVLVQGNYHPLTMLSLALDERIGAGGPWAQHATNITLHALNAVLLFVLMRFVFNSTSMWILLAASTLFVVHPVQVESVAWISERKNLLYAFFSLLTSVIYIMYLRRNGKLLYLALLTAALAAMLSKVQAASLPLVLFGILLMHSGWPVARRRWLELLPIFGVAMVAAWIGFSGQIEGGYVHAQRDSGFLGRAIVIVKATVLPYWAILWPWSISIIKPLPRSWDASMFVSGAMILGAVFLWLRAIRHSDWRVMGMGIILAALVLPVSQVFPFGSMVSADRYSYLPLAALLMVALGLIERFRFRYAYLFLFAISLPLFLATRERVQAWCDPVRLFAQALDRYPNSELAHMNIAAQFVKKDDLDAAILHLDQALVLDPTLLEARQLRADLFANQGTTQEAFDEYSRVILMGEGWSGIWRARIGRAKLYIAKGNAMEALNDLFVAEVPEGHSSLDYLVGLCYAMLGDHVTAIHYFNRSWEQGNVRSEVQLNLAISCGRLSDLVRSAQFAKAVLEKEPNNAEAHFIMGLSEFELGVDGCASLLKAVDLGHKRAQGAFDHHCR